MQNKMAKLKNIVGYELDFPEADFLAPVGEFECSEAIAKILLTNDAIVRVESKTVMIKPDKDEKVKEINEDGS